jgi:hypothetical protein
MAMRNLFYVVLGFVAVCLFASFDVGGCNPGRLQPDGLEFRRNAVFLPIKADEKCVVKGVEQGAVALEQRIWMLTTRSPVTRDSLTMRMKDEEWDHALADCKRPYAWSQQNFPRNILGQVTSKGKAAWLVKLLWVADRTSPWVRPKAFRSRILNVGLST